MICKHTRMDLVTLDPLTSTYKTGPELLDSRVRYRQISTCVRRKTSKQQSQTATSVQETIVLAPMCIIPVRLREIVSNRIDHSIKYASRILFRFENWVYRPSVGETAGACYKAWLGWYLSEKDCLLCKNGCQFWWEIYVERGWSTPASEVTL